MRVPRTISYLSIDYFDDRIRTEEELKADLRNDALRKRAIFLDPEHRVTKLMDEQTRLARLADIESELLQLEQYSLDELFAPFPEDLEEIREADRIEALYDAKKRGSPWPVDFRGGLENYWREAKTLAKKYRGSKERRVPRGER